jgi:hypothetical protein
MTLLDEAVRGLRGAGLGAVREAAWHLALKYGASLDADPVVGADWDLLVVLDACRADLWAEVVGPDDDLPVGTSRIAPGGTSTEWLDAVFGRESADLDDVGYVTANPYSASHVDGSRLAHFEEVWRTGWDDDAGTVEPRAVTDAAVRAARGPDPDRLIVHYMQPHFPSLVDDRDDGVDLDSFGAESLSVWEDLRFGRRSRTEVWESYRANLELVLEDVRLLLSNVDADRAAITADHGNAMGERGIYGHAAGLALRPLREVPWAVTEATDRHTYQPEAAAEAEAAEEGADDDAVAERLRALGYR